MATTAINKVHGFTDPLSKPVMQSNNPDHFSTAMPRMFPIHQHIYLYSVAKRGFKRSHPYFKGELKGCKPTERYVQCAIIPDPPQQLAVDAERGGLRVEVEPRDEAGWRVAIDILNPNNPTLDPYWKPNAVQSAAFSIGDGMDIIRFGLFPSLNNPPTEEELQRAELSRDDSRQRLIDEAFAEQASNPQGFRNWLRTHPEIKDAMDAFGVQADWYKLQEAKMSCPNCGDQIKTGLAFHKSSAGVLCVIDPQKAFKAGAITKEQLADLEPEQKRGPGNPNWVKKG
jgi:hypothetical protein